jgi:hypothetical protein
MQTDTTAPFCNSYSPTGLVCSATASGLVCSNVEATAQLYNGDNGVKQVGLLVHSWCGVIVLLTLCTL